jgi:hypothetical protein
MHHLHFSLIHLQRYVTPDEMLTVVRMREFNNVFVKVVSPCATMEIATPVAFSR